MRSWCARTSCATSAWARTIIRRRARRHRRDRPRGDGDHLRDRRGVRADRLHERHRRPVLLPVRHDRRRRGAGVAVRELHARSDALVGLARSAGIALLAACRGWVASWIASSASSNGSHAVYGRLLEWAISDAKHRLHVPAFGLWTALRHATVERAQAPPGDGSAIRGIVLSDRAADLCGSFALLPFIGKEFSPQVDESFISLRLNTPVGIEPRVHRQQGARGRSEC